MLMAMFVHETLNNTQQDPATTGTFFSWYDDLVVYAEAEGTATLVPRYEQKIRCTYMRCTLRSTAVDSTTGHGRR